jgi:hypothetical protein
MYDSNLKARWDYENSIAFAEEKAAEKARHEEAVAIATELKRKDYRLNLLQKQLNYLKTR